MATEYAAPFEGSTIATSQQFRDRQRPTQPDMIDADYTSSAAAVSDGGSGASINIQDYRAIVQAGLYELTSGPLNLAVAANGGGSNRFDIVTCRYDASASPKIRTTIIQGTPGAGLPALTNSATGVWDFPIAHYEKTPAGAIVNITDRRKFSDGNGGIIANDPSGQYPPPAPRIGHRIMYRPSNHEYFWDGSNWVWLPQRVRLLTTGSIANSTAETVVGTFSSPVFEVGAPVPQTYRARIFGSVDGVTGGPTVTFRVRLDNLTGTLLTAAFPAIAVLSGGGTNRGFAFDLAFMITTTGAGGVLKSHIQLAHVIAATGFANRTETVTAGAGDACDTTTGHGLVLTAQWSSANAGNVARTLGGTFHKETLLT